MGEAVTGRWHAFQTREADVFLSLRGYALKPYPCTWSEALSLINRHPSLHFGYAPMIPLSKDTTASFCIPPE